MDLSMGFRGVPSVGTVFMNRLRDEAFFAQLLSQYHGAAGSTVFFAAGSVFGGTGAAALPVVGRALRDGVQQRPGASAIRGAERARLGAALLLPYFTLPSPGGAPVDGGPRPENALFAHNAAGALPTYLDRERDPGYGAYYLVGDSLPREQSRNELGGEAQANAPHYVELFAALAALDFTARGGEDREQRLPIYRATGVGSEEPGWGDLPVDRGTRRALKGALVALHTFLTFFRRNGGSPPDLAAQLHGVTWAELLRVPPATWTDRSEALDAVGKSWMYTWEWLRELRRSTPALRLAAATEDQPSRVPTHALIEGFGLGGERGRRSDDVFNVFRAWNTRPRAAGTAGSAPSWRCCAPGASVFPKTVSPKPNSPARRRTEMATPSRTRQLLPRLRPQTNVSRPSARPLERGGGSAELGSWRCPATTTAARSARASSPYPARGRGSSSFATPCSTPTTRPGRWWRTSCSTRWSWPGCAARRRCGWRRARCAYPSW
jgi:hypothetical protein